MAAEVLAAQVDRAHALLQARRLHAAHKLLAATERAAALAGQHHQQGRALYWLAALAGLRGEHLLAEEYLAAALDLSRQHGLTALQAGFHFAEANNRYMGGRIAEAERALGSCQMLAQQSGDLRRQAAAYGLQGDCSVCRGRLEDAFAYYALAADLLRSCEEWGGLMAVLVDSMGVAFQLEQDIVVEQMNAEILSYRDFPNHTRFVARSLIQQATNQLVQNNLPRAEQLLAEAASHADLRAYWDRMDFEVAHGRLALARGHATHAVRHFAVARRLAQANHSRFRLAETRLEHARAQLALGRRRAAGEALVDAELAFEHIEALGLLAQTHCIWAQLMQASGRTEAARAALKRADALAQRLGSPAGRSLRADLRRTQQLLAD
jgi:hypothetical protein